MAVGFSRTRRGLLELLALNAVHWLRERIAPRPPRSCWSAPAAGSIATSRRRNIAAHYGPYEQRRFICRWLDPGMTLFGGGLRSGWFAGPRPTTQVPAHAEGQSMPRPVRISWNRLRLGQICRARRARATG